MSNSSQAPSRTPSSDQSVNRAGDASIVEAAPENSGSGNAAVVVAAVDLGSNSFHMLVARTGETGLQVIDRLREPIRLARGLTDERRLTEEAETVALECLRRFGQRLQDLPAHRVRVVGTNTLRRLRRSRKFLAEAEAALGHRIEVIAGVEEARLIYGGVTHGLAADGCSRLVVDIGGGSTELIIGGDAGPQLMHSVHMGCVTWTQDFFASGELTKKSLRRARLQARAALTYLVRDYRAHGWDVALGASGSIRSVWKVGAAMGLGEHLITRKSIDEIERACIASGHIDKLDLPALRDDRREVFAGSLSVLGGVFDALKIDQMEVSDRALREGVIYDLLGRLSDQDVRDRSTSALASRFKLDREQAGRVESLALSLLAQVADVWQLDNENCRDFLAWSAQLHEIGMAISHAGYHKHSAYVLAQVDLHGFSRTDQQILAAIVRGHRGKWSSSWYEELPKVWRVTAQRLAILLRIAVILNRGRNLTDAPEITAQASRSGLNLILPAEWLETHALTLTDLEQDARRLRNSEFSLKFE